MPTPLANCFLQFAWRIWVGTCLATGFLVGTHNPFVSIAAIPDTTRLAKSIRLPESVQEPDELASQFREELLPIVDMFLNSTDIADSDRKTRLAQLKSAFPNPDANDFRYHCLAAAIGGDRAKLASEIGRWTTARPDSIDANLLVFLVPGPGDANPDFLELAWKNLERAASVHDPDRGQYPVTQAIEWFLAQQDHSGCLRAIKAFSNGPNADEIELWQCIRAFQGTAPGAVFDDREIRLQFVATVQSVIRSVVRQELLGPETARSDLLEILVQRDFLPRLHGGEEWLPAIEMFSQCLVELESGSVADPLRQDIQRILNEAQLYLHARTDVERAGAMARELVEEDSKRFQAGQLSVSRMADTFTHALTLANRDTFPQVIRKMTSLGFFDNEKIAGEFIQGPPDSGEDLESNRFAISGMWNAWFSRQVEFGTSANTVRAIEELLTLANQEVQFGDSEIERVLDDEPGSRFLEDNLKLSLTIARCSAAFPDQPLLPMLNVELEHWLNRAGESGELAGKIVVLVLTDDDSAIGEQKEWLSQLNTGLRSRFGTDAKLVAVIDDDWFQGQSPDGWIPPPVFESLFSEELAEFRELEFPLVYAYRNKLLDALIPANPERDPAYRRVLIFDRQGHLQRLVFPNQESLEPVETAVAKVFEAGDGTAGNVGQE